MYFATFSPWLTTYINIVEVVIMEAPSLTARALPAHCWEPYWCLWPMSPLRAIQLSMVCAIAWSHIDVCGLCCHWVLYWSEWHVLPPKAMVILGPVLRPRAMSGSVVLLQPAADVCVTTKDHEDAHDLCCSLNPCCCVGVTHQRPYLSEQFVPL